MDHTITDEDLQTINELLLELATELDLHYDDEDMFALAPSFQRIKKGCALLEKLNHTIHPDVLKIIARYNRTNQ
ncbi:hypothetical protein [Mesorhizobium sp. WSM2239]|uniref:Uncharacterized protein n=2 Tax=unclassified Mesorhizobium TaxID=325217 RepID=A0AAU8DEG6_9HYPH